MYEISAARPHDSKIIESLLDQVFGPDRFNKTSYRYRDGVDPIPELCQVAHSNHRLVATIRYWPVTIGPKAVPAVLMGPVGVQSDRRGEGIGVALIRRTLDKAREMGYGVCVLVGDAAYYQRFGFEPAEKFGIAMPNQPNRLMAKALVEGGLDGVSGDIAKVTPGS